MPHRRFARFLAVPLALAGLVACSNTPDRADTIPNDDNAPAATTTKAKPTAGRAAGGLTDAELKRAVLTIDDMPTGWTQEKVTPEADDAKISPERCAALFEDQQEPPAKAEAKFMHGDVTTLEETVSSWPDNQSKRLVELRDRFTKCPEFTSTSGGETVTFKAKSLSYPNLGDRTLALRFTTKISGFPVTVDAVYVAVGRTGIALVASGLQPLDGDELETIGRKAVARVAG